MKENEVNLTGKASIDKPWQQYQSKQAIECTLPEDTAYLYLIKQNVKHFNRTALNYFDRKITYGELFLGIDNVAKALVESGIQKKDSVTIAMPTTPETIYLVYALNKIGAIANMVDPRSSKEQLEHYTEETHSKMVFTIDGIMDKFKDVKKIPGVKEVVSISPAESMPLGLKLGYQAKSFFENSSKKENDTMTCTKWDDFYKRGKESIRKIQPVSYEKNAPAVIVHTGGTTGISKGVILSNYSINVAAYDCIISGFDFKREDKWLNIMPPFIAYGIGNGLHMPLLVGMEVILIPKFDPKKFDKLMIKYKPNHMVGVPSHYSDLIESKRMGNVDLSYWKSAIVGGDRMKVKLEKEVNVFLHKHNCKQNIKKGYGMSEVMAGVTACSSDEFNDIGSVGIPFPHSVIGIFEPDTDKELGYNQEGEVCIKTPNQMVGYLDNPEEEKGIIQTHSDGSTWVHSKDWGYITPDGKLFVIDRIKNMITRPDGFKLYPEKIEDAIMRHPDVEGCMVIGVDDENHVQGQLPKAFVTLKEGSTVSNIEGELEILCKKLLAEYSQPVGFEVLEQLPLTKVGKLDYNALRKMESEKKNTASYQYKKELSTLKS